MRNRMKKEELCGNCGGELPNREILWCPHCGSKKFKPQEEIEHLQSKYALDEHFVKERCQRKNTKCTEEIERD